MKTLDEILSDMPLSRRRNIDDRAAQLAQLANQELATGGLRTGTRSDRLEEAKKARSASIQAKESSAHHGRDLEEMKRVAADAADAVKIGPNRQRRRDTSKRP